MFSRPRWLKVPLVALLTFCQLFPPTTFAKSPVKLKNFVGEIDFSTEGTSPFTLEGTASHLGRYTAYGEVDFLPGEGEGTLVGNGVAVFEAANGDLLVGVVTWEVEAEVNGERASRIHFSWRDSVEFGNGMTVSNTGRFVKDRPQGLVVIAIIAVLIGLLYPAVVTCGPGGIGC
jgi:hypothetical protein